MVPQSAAEDDRLKPVMNQFRDRLKSHIDGGELEVVTRLGSEITLSTKSPIILPCITATGVGGDISAALGKADIGRRLIMK